MYSLKSGCANGSGSGCPGGQDGGREKIGNGGKNTIYYLNGQSIKVANWIS